MPRIGRRANSTCIFWRSAYRDRQNAHVSIPESCIQHAHQYSRNSDLWPFVCARERIRERLSCAKEIGCKNPTTDRASRRAARRRLASYISHTYLSLDSFYKNFAEINAPGWSRFNAIRGRIVNNYFTSHFAGNPGGFFAAISLILIKPCSATYF